ncbi:MAG: hypothetical protein ABFS32_04370 [Bacteroidota bacterium]
MKTDSEKYIFKTNYFKKKWTWYRRAFVLIILSLGALMIPLDDDFLFIKLVFVILVTFYLIAKPKDDLAIDKKYLYHIKSSMIKSFTRIDVYELSNLYSIRCGGIHSAKWELVDFFNGGGNMGGYSNTIEMTFEDDSSKSLELAISRDYLDKIVTLAREIREETKPNIG